jgi:hypothetical protein
VQEVRQAYLTLLGPTAVQSQQALVENPKRNFIAERMARALVDRTVKGKEKAEAESSSPPAAPTSARPQQVARSRLRGVHRKSAVLLATACLSQTEVRPHIHLARRKPCRQIAFGLREPRRRVIGRR